MSARPFVVMAKPIGSACNMQCAYCYYLHAGNEKTSSPVMSDEVLDSFIKKYILSCPGPVISFTWHGGEPTLAGLPFYEKALALQQKYLAEREGCEIWNNLQTNGLLLDDEWCAFLAKHHFDVGISIDGTKLCHDTYRKDPLGQDTYEKTAAAIDRLKTVGIRPDLLCTVNQVTAVHGKEVYRALRDFDTGWMQFIPIVVHTKTGISPESVTPEAYGEFLKDVFAEWFFHDLGRTEVQLFSEMSLALAGEKPNLCMLGKTCGNVLIVEKDGGIYSCDHFVDPQHRIGSVLTDDFQEVLSSDFQTEFGLSKETKLTGECRRCPYLSLCGGACPKDRSAKSKDGEDGQYFLCPGLYTFFDYAVPHLKRAMQLSSEKKNPSQMMEILIREERKKYQMISRNDPCPCGSGRKYKQCCQRRLP
ncbi:MAG: anaerobic sulfatase maturase [Firmicutes bacterium]|nr:anaerobic sulfatase maturase [Bacillota bacterium]